MMMMFSNKDRQDLESKIIKLLSEKLIAEAKLESAVNTIEDKNKEITRLLGQVDRLQDALVASSAPRAYEDMRNDQAAPDEVDSKVVKRREKEAKINAELLYNMEQPTFIDADDMIKSLTGAVDIDEFFNRTPTPENAES